MIRSDTILLGGLLVGLIAIAAGCNASGTNACAVDGDCNEGRACVANVCGAPGAQGNSPDGGDSNTDNPGQTCTDGPCDGGPDAHSAWTAVAPMPIERSDFAAVTGADGLIYVLGGISGITPTSRVDAYAPRTGLWTLAPSFTTAQSRLAAAGSDGRIYAFESGELSSSAESYGPGTNESTWSTVKSLPTARSDFAAATDADGRVYVIGGAALNGDGGGHSTPSTKVEVYTPSSDTWTAVANLQTPRAGLAAVTGADGRIYAIGGYATGTGAAVPLTTVEAYNPATDKWTTVASMVTPRQYHAAVVGADGRIFAVGGESQYYGDGSNYDGESSVEVYTPSTNTWTSAPSMTVPRSHLAATFTAGSIYAIGGVRHNTPGPSGTGILNTVEKYAP